MSDVEANVGDLDLNEGEKKLSKKELNKLARQQKKAEKKQVCFLNFYLN